MAVVRRDLVTLLVLGSLADTPLCAYELRKRTSRCLGAYYKVSDGTLYPLVRSLAEEGFIEQVEPHAGGRSDRVDYRITATGRARMCELIEAPLHAQAPLSAVDVYARVIMGDRVAHAVREALLARYARQLGEEERAIQALLEDADVPPAVKSVLSLRVRQVGIEREWAHSLARRED